MFFLDVQLSNGNTINVFFWKMLSQQAGRLFFSPRKVTQFSNIGVETNKDKTRHKQVGKLFITISKSTPSPIQMPIFVDVEVDIASFDPVRNIFFSQTTLLTSILNNSDRNHDSPPERLFETFMTLIKRIIERRIEIILFNNKEATHYTVEELLKEVHGAVEIQGLRSVQARDKLIENVIKVLFSQVQTQENNLTVNDCHDNIILNLFVRNLYIERRFRPTIPYNNNTTESLEETVSSILKGKDCSLNTSIGKLPHNNTIKVNFYYFPINRIDNKCNPLMKSFDEFVISDKDSNNFPKIGRRITKEEKPVELDLPQFSTTTSDLVTSTILPSEKFEGLWESLYFEEDFKQSIFSTASLSLELSKLKEKNSYIVQSDLEQLGMSGLILIHGPPGTGKTSICRAVCQKLAIRRKNIDLMKKNESFPVSILLELRCSRIFSRWFGNSSKNISAIFQDIEVLLEQKKGTLEFVCLMIDEVETIASCRNQMISNNESNESVRIVNSLLTHLDKLKKFDNFFVLATSNYVDSLDSAFVDRADMVYHIPNPSIIAIEQIISSSIVFLSKLNIVTAQGTVEKLLGSDIYRAIIRSVANKCLVC